MTKHKVKIGGYKRGGEHVKAHRRRGGSVKPYMQSRPSGKSKR